MPVNVQSHPLYNPDLDYSVYLSHPFFFILFQVLILLVTVYALGSEIKFRTGDAWLESADGNIFTAVVAKLLPYTVIFIVMAIFANYVMFGVLHIPFSCGFWPLNLTAVLFVIATQALGVFIFSIFPAISIIISIASMVGSLGATLSGVTFPGPVHVPGPFIMPRSSFRCAISSKSTRTCCTGITALRVPGKTWPRCSCSFRRHCCCYRALNGPF